MNVLIVEDEALIAMYLELLLEDFGHHVCAVASSAADAISHAGVHLPDVALMDICLAGGSSGVDAARDIYLRHAIRCIFLSSNLDGDTRAVLRSYQPVDFLDKPVLPSVLRLALQKVASG